MRTSVKKALILPVAILLTCLGFDMRAENIFITGDAIAEGWTSSNPASTRLEEQADGTYKWSGALKDGGRFRFLTTNKWYPTYTTTSSTHQNVSEGTYDIQYDVTGRSGEPSFKAVIAGDYTIVLDLIAMTMNIHLDKRADGPMHIYLTGSATPVGWSTTGIDMELLDNGHYTWTGDLKKENEGRFRFLTTHSWYPTYTTAEAGHALVKAGQYALAYYEVGVPGEPSFKVEIPGNYTIDLDIDAMIMTLTLNTAFEEKYMYLVGTSLTGKTPEEGEEIPTAEMHITGDYLFEWSGDLYPETTDGTPAGFRLSPDLAGALVYTCRTDIPGNEDIYSGETYDLFEKTEGEGNDNWFTPAIPGRYTIVVDTRLMTMSVLRQRSELYLVGGAVTGANTPWGLDDKYLSKMTETTTPLVFEWNGYLHATSQDGKPAKFKFLTSTGAWTGYVNGSGADTTVEYDGVYPILDSTKPGSGDNQFLVPEDGEYYLTVDIRALTLTVARDKNSSVEAVYARNAEFYISGRTIYISAEDAVEVAIYDLTGRTVAANRIKEGSMELPAGGVYLLSVDNKVSKIAVR